MARARSNYALTFAVLATAAVAFSLLQSLVIPAIPQLEATLHTSESGASWLLTAYLLSAAIFTPILGRVGDMLGKERIIVAVLVALSVGSLISALATSLPVMLVGRIIQGAGGAVFPLAFGIIRDEFPAERVAGAIGVMSAILGAGAGAGIVLAGPILVHLNYHWLFWIPLIMSVAATIATALFVPESPVRSPGRINWTGAVLMSGWLITGLLAISYAPTWGWASSSVLGLFGATAVLLAPLGRLRDPVALAVGRHADDAHPRRVDHEPRRPALRVRHVRHVHRVAPVHPDADPRRVRIRGLGDPVGSLSASVRRDDGDRRPHDRSPHRDRGVEDDPGGGVALRGLELPRPRARPQRGMDDVPRHGPAGHRDRHGVRQHGEFRSSRRCPPNRPASPPG